MKRIVNKAKVDLLSSRGDLLHNLTIVLKYDPKYNFYFNILTKNNNYYWLFANLVPDNYELLAHNSIPVTNNYYQTMLWYSLFFNYFHSKLSVFAERKALFENYFLNGEYEKAENELDYIENNVCFSIWGLKNRILLKNASNGNTTNDFIDEIRSEVISFIAHVFSNMTDANEDYNSYKEYIKDLFEGFPEESKVFYVYVLDANIECSERTNI